MLTYKIVKRRNPATRAEAFHPVLTKAQTVTREQISQRIERRCTLSSPDIVAVLDALEDEVIDICLSGGRVAFGNLGSFRTSITSKGSETKEDVNAGKITAARVLFRPSVKMRNAFDLKRGQIKFQKDDTGTAV